MTGVLFLVSGFFILLYKPTHFNIMRRALGTDHWKKSWGKDFDSEWTEDRRLLDTLAYLSMIIAFLSFVCCLNLYSNVIDKSDLSNLLIYTSLFLTFLFAFLALREYYIIRELELELGGDRVLWIDQLLEILYWLLILLIILSFIACIIGITKVSITFPIMATILLILAVVGLLVLACYTKSYKK